VCKTIEGSAIKVSQCEDAMLVKSRTVFISIHDMTVGMQGYGIGLTEMHAPRH
jgi:hypothetical protein